MNEENIHNIINDYLKEKSDYIQNIADQSKYEIVKAFEQLLGSIQEIIGHITYINESKIKFKNQERKAKIWMN